MEEEYSYCVTTGEISRMLILLHPLKNKTGTAFSKQCALKNGTVLRTSHAITVNPLVGLSFGSRLFSEIFEYNDLRIVGPRPKCDVDLDRTGVACKLQDVFGLFSG